ncbi:SMI1/KNR4 family protein [Lysinibacillus cavernae]|uniref:SMI1/KNR4 family protein n=1 Tax=Lysinibacillus cavernae TaxID=2666135 RepID=UPI0012D8B1C4|nr:SMI1/KNR4 family protein [Lysinibacillus cavernae]
MNASQRELDAVIEKMRSFIQEIQKQDPDFYNAYPVVFHNHIEDEISHFVDCHWRLPEEYLYFLQRYIVEGVTWNTGDYINLQIYGAKDLVRGQEGYNYNPVTDEVILEWPHDYLVIATDEGDPYCLDLSRGDTAIFSAYHGTGSWNFSMAYDNLVMFLESVLIPPGLDEELSVDSSSEYYELYITGKGKDKIKTLLLLKKILSCDYSQAKMSLEQAPLLVYRGVETGALRLEGELQRISADYEKTKISLAEFLK